MSQQLISLSPDLKRLQDEGYEIEVRGGHLLIHHVPYVDSNKSIQYGTLVSTLTLQSNIRTGLPDNHVIHFIGENPCTIEGVPISAIQHVNAVNKLTQDISVDRSFSNKPPNGYPDYYAKVTRYIEIISAPAKYLDSTVSEKTFKVLPDRENQSVFHYIDTNSSRANLDLINSKLKAQKIAIIGLGGTGAYVLDMIAKTPVSEIHLYDGDIMSQHNAFRTPGAMSLEDLEQQYKKSEYYQMKYSVLHKGIKAFSEYVTEANIQVLTNMDYVFVCVDSNSARRLISEFLKNSEIPFTDVGLGVSLVGDQLSATIRTTSAKPESFSHLDDHLPMVELKKNDYNTNIQISELNALNAVFAVLQWKKYCEFYHDEGKEFHSVYRVGLSKMICDAPE